MNREWLDDPTGRSCGRCGHVQTTRAWVCHCLRSPPGASPQPPYPEGSGTVSALKDCPFCGGDGEEVALCYDTGSTPQTGTDWFVRCYVCHVETARRDTEADAIAAWNTRAPLPQPPPVIGWRWVPDEPTGAMISEGYEAIRMEEKWPSMLAGVYRAMIEAVPTLDRGGEPISSSVSLRERDPARSDTNSTTTGKEPG